MPASDRIAVTEQQRDVNQRELSIDYVLRPESAKRVPTTMVLGLTGVLIAIAVVWQQRRARA